MLKRAFRKINPENLRLSELVRMLLICANFFFKPSVMVQVNYCNIILTVNKEEWVAATRLGKRKLVKRPAGEMPTGFKNMKSLAVPAALHREVFRISCVKSKHIIVARNYSACCNGFS